MGVWVFTPESSQIAAAKYTAEKEELEVYFLSGAVYVYKASEEDWREFKMTPSKGRFVLGLHEYQALRAKTMP